MLKKKSRIIQFLRFEMSYSARGRDIELRPDILTTLEKLQKNLENGPLKKDYNKERVKIGLRVIEFDDKKEAVTLLWGGGDAENVDPCFWNHVDDGTRTESTKTNEVVGFSCHVIIGLTPTPLGGYIMLKEQVPIFGKGVIEKALNAILATHGQDILQDENGNEFKATPRIKIDPLPSQSLKESFMARTLKGIRAVRIRQGDNKFDENFSVRKEDHAIRITPNEPLIHEKAVTAIKKAMQKLRNDKYEEMFIEYSSPDRDGSLPLSLQDISDADIEKHLFERKEVLHVNKEIEQQCQEIHEEMATKLCAWAIAELKSLERKYASTNEPSSSPSQLP